jgi:hypothetical protein
MKTKLYSFVLIISSVLLTTSCEESDFFPCISPYGREVEESRFTADFTSIQVGVKANVYVEYAPENSISIIASENILEQISTSNRNNTLYVDNSRCLRVDNNDIIIYITTPEIGSVKLLGSGNIFIDSPFYGERMVIEISGSGSISFPELSYDEVRTSISGSGNVSISGDTFNHLIQISGSGKINAYELVSDEVKIHISGSGSAKVNVIEHLDAKISGSGEVYYMGNPHTRINISGSGSVHHVDSNWK